MACAGDTLNIRFNNALNLPLSYRCNELTKMFEDYGIKELQLVLPHLLENIFGLTNQTGWSLRTLYCNTHPHEFEIVSRFLHPNGPLFKLCYRLLTECNIKYEFSLSYLPGKVRKLIEDGMVPPFYADKIQIDPQTRVPTSLILNPFEFYVFHFAYHIVNPWLQRIVDYVTPALRDSLYFYLSDEYLTHFLPCDGSTVPPYSGFYIHPKSTLPLQTASRPVRSPTLFRQSVLLKQGSTSSSLHSSPTLPQQSSLVEIWRSELVIQVFIDFWLSYGETDMPQLGAATPPRLYVPEVVSSSTSYLQPHSNIALCYCSHYSSRVPMDNSYSYLHNQMQDHSIMPLRHYPDLLPSTENIRLVRNLIKHLHYFANSIAGDLSAMDELKRIILPSSQSKIYGFLRHTIHHWPLDSSFRYILETWISYIQPWRYIDWFHRHSRSNEHDVVRVIDKKWQNFIAENLLSYTVIFRQLLPRFSRLDLATPKNAQMLFRVTRVFSYPNLNKMLMEVERCLDDVSVHGLPNESISIRNQPETTHRGHKWNAVVRQQILELEGPGYKYKPMFGTQTVTQIFQFMLSIKRASETARNLLVQLEVDAKNQSSGFFSSFVALFSSAPSERDEYSIEERKRVPSYLETSLCHLSTIFEIDLARLPCVSYTSQYEIPHSSLGTTSLYQSEVTPSIPTSMQTPVSTLLASRDWKERRKHIKYEGDPDLQPIRSTENAFLVRLLYQITSKLNETYTLEMCHLHDHQGLLGSIARQILCPPMVTRTYDKSKPGFSPQIESVLPPRLSLRGFASHKTIAYLLIGMVFAWFFGYGFSAYFFFLFILWFFLVLIKAIFGPLFKSNQQSPQSVTRMINQSDLSEPSF